MLICFICNTMLKFYYVCWLSPFFCQCWLASVTDLDEHWHIITIWLCLLPANKELTQSLWWAKYEVNVVYKPTFTSLWGTILDAPVNEHSYGTCMIKWSIDKSFTKKIDGDYFHSKLLSITRGLWMDGHEWSINNHPHAWIIVNYECHDLW